MEHKKRLIDAVRFREVLYRYANAPHVTMFSPYSRCMRVAIDTCIEMLDIQRTVEAEPVVHGHWVSLTECANAGVYCSVCNKKVYKEDYAWCNRKNKLCSNYCPNCGAKMDGERKDNG